MEFVTLSNGVKMPLEGFGVFQIPDAKVCEQAVTDALSTEAIAMMKEFGVMPEAWGPLAEGKHGIFTHPALTEIGKKHGKTAAQVALKWNAQRDGVIIPKSIHRKRMEENFNIWDFTLSDSDMAAVEKLDLGHSEIIDHFTADTAKFLNSRKIHD